MKTSYQIPVKVAPYISMLSQSIDLSAKLYSELCILLRANLLMTARPGNEELVLVSLSRESLLMNNIYSMTDAFESSWKVNINGRDVCGSEC